MKAYFEKATVFCYWSNLKNHPKCIHGPLLLFGREVNGIINKFYACSACRDRKLCSIYIVYGQNLSKHHKLFWKLETEKYLQSFNHQQLFVYFKQLMKTSSHNRMYCHTCEKLLILPEKQKHNNHEITENLSDYLMSHPTEVLKPLENSKKEAQYLFSKKTVVDIVNILIKLNAKYVVCIGTPRIYEYINTNLKGKMFSLLLDFDGRFHNFFGPLNYCWYNLFNHHFFYKSSKDIFKKFLTQNDGKNMYLICDPPFGGRVEPISQTIKIIFDLHKKLNKIDISENELKIFFIFPYFMEAIMKEKSNPLNIIGGLSNLKMTDYKVEYDNHPLFISKVNNRSGSQIRIYTNVPLNLINLSKSDGYKYCKRCQRWVSLENKHCKFCHNCTSKNGLQYIHCKLCQLCVKPSWKHCKFCNRCLLPNHSCGQRPKIRSCFLCKQMGHTRKQCSLSIFENSDVIINLKKRKTNTENETFSLGKQTLEKKIKF